MVQVNGTILRVNGQAYEARHVGYVGLRKGEFPSQYGICRCNTNNIFSNPFANTCPPTPNGPYDIDPQRIGYDLTLIQQMNANGIRTWDQVNSILLNEANTRNLTVAASIVLPWANTYDDPIFRQNLINDKINNLSVTVADTANSVNVNTANTANTEYLSTISNLSTDFNLKFNSFESKFSMQYLES